MVPAAIANTIFDATDVRMRKVPMTAQRMKDELTRLYRWGFLLQQPPATRNQKLRAEAGTSRAPLFGENMLARNSARSTPDRGLVATGNPNAARVAAGEVHSHGFNVAEHKARRDAAAQTVSA
jgi:hypothetical protein